MVEVRGERTGAHRETCVWTTDGVVRADVEQYLPAQETGYFDGALPACFGGCGGGEGTWSSSRSVYGEMFGPSTERYARTSSSEHLAAQETGYFDEAPPACFSGGLHRRRVDVKVGRGHCANGLRVSLLACCGMHRVLFCACVNVVRAVRLLTWTSCKPQVQRCAVCTRTAGGPAVQGRGVSTMLERLIVSRLSNTPAHAEAPPSSHSGGKERERYWMAPA
ncbi:hypothetical protein B0H12DRAFT_1102129 [Mycena haematopus]|nr:hypothetical protein B0H12DRAFT_1102129 [Mycena haematopus]